MLRRELQIFKTDAHPCSYLSNQVARTEVALPGEFIDGAVYGDLLRRGFRRSGMITYRPGCDRCRACVSVRVLVDEFEPSRSQRRAWARHHNLRDAATSLRFVDAHYALYLRYQASRHAGGDMDRATEEEYSAFLLESRVDSRLVEFHDDNKLVMVSVIDAVSDGLSSVYTFFDPDLPAASLGTYSILWQIEQCRRNSLPYLYLGYWIKESRKMSYKSGYRPLEAFTGGRWLRLRPDELDDQSSTAKRPRG